MALYVCIPSKVEVTAPVCLGEREDLLGTITGEAALAQGTPLGFEAWYIPAMTVLLKGRLCGVESQQRTQHFFPRRIVKHQRRGLTSREKMRAGLPGGRLGDPLSQRV